MIFALIDVVVGIFKSIRHWFRKMFCKSWSINEDFQQKCNMRHRMCRWQTCPKRIIQRERIENDNRRTNQ